MNINLFEEVKNGCHGGHGYTGYEVHMEMSRIGWYNTKKRNDPKSKNSISIWIYAEGNRPIKHFHFYRGDNREFGGCIMLDQSMYFPHDKHIEILKDKEIIHMVNFFNSLDTDTNLTIWKMILLSWNQQNSNFKIKMDAEIPDYNNGIKEYKYDKKYLDEKMFKFERI
jgi:hypothetical protein